MRLVHNAKLQQEGDDAPTFTAVVLDDETQNVVMLVDKDDGTDLVARQVKRDWAWRHGYPLVQIFPETSKDKATRLIKKLYDDVKSGEWQKRYDAKKAANHKMWQEGQARRRKQEQAAEARRKQQENAEAWIFSQNIFEEQRLDGDEFSLI